MLPFLTCSAYVGVQPSEFWGGGQRTTLEMLACGLPVVVMKDSPKNREYIEESGCGEIVEPDPNRIVEAVEGLKASWTEEDAQRAVDYVNNRWSHIHYANNLLKWINQNIQS
jgi:glycosyltransferase involved in cell wall biosynthesis